MQTVLEGGFADRPREAAAAFRAALDAMARPARIREARGAAPPAGLSPGAGALLLCLADAETPVWLPERLRDGPVAQWLRFHTNAPAAPDRAAARFGLGDWTELAPPGGWPLGDPAYPDRSATLIVEVPALEGGAPLRLSGPGIGGTLDFAPDLPADAAAVLRENARGFPLGLDFFFAAGARIAALPRSTRLEG